MTPLLQAESSPHMLTHPGGACDASTRSLWYHDLQNNTAHLASFLVPFTFSWFKFDLKTKSTILKSVFIISVFELLTVNSHKIPTQLHVYINHE